MARLEAVPIITVPAALGSPLTAGGAEHNAHLHQGRHIAGSASGSSGASWVDLIHRAQEGLALFLLEYKTRSIAHKITQQIPGLLSLSVWPCMMQNGTVGWGDKGAQAYFPVPCRHTGGDRKQILLRPRGEFPPPLLMLH